MVPATTSSVNRPSVPARVVALVAGLVNAAAVLALYVRDGYPALESTGATAALVVTMALVGFVPVLVSAHTRLLTPALGWIGLLVGTLSVELSSPSPAWGELGDHVVVDGPTYVSSFANAWALWLALLVYAGVLEFGLRRRYGLAQERLRNLPSIPDSRLGVAGIALGAAGLVGVATTLLVVDAGIRPTVAALAVFAFAVAVAAVPVVGLFTRGLLSPVVLFLVLVPSFLVVEVFVTTDSPVHILLFGPYAVGLAIVSALEAVLRARFTDGNGGCPSPNLSN